MLRIDASALDYVIIAIYFATVIGRARDEEAEGDEVREAEQPALARR
jgi:hypothetical protein